MGQVEDALADLLDRPIGCDVAQPDHEMRDWPAGADVQGRDGNAEDVERRSERRARVRRAGVVLEPEVGREAVRRGAGAPAERTRRTTGARAVLQAGDALLGGRLP